MIATAIFLFAMFKYMSNSDKKMEGGIFLLIGTVMVDICAWNNLGIIFGGCV